MGQYDYQGTPQSRMYDWLVTRNGDSLSLCVDVPESGVDIGTIEGEDLEYIRSLVAADLPELRSRDEFQTEMPWLLDTDEEMRRIEEEEKDAPKARSGGRDHYTNPDGSSKIPEPLGATGELGVIQVIK